ncbi:MAG: ECF-type sigma factor [Planctomycetota bacterium]
MKNTEFSYGELRDIAVQCMSGENSGWTWTPTDVANEVVLGLLHSGRGLSDLRTRAFTKMLVTRVVIDRARSRRRLKRGGDLKRVEFHDPLATGDWERRVQLDDAFRELDSRGHAQLSEVLSLRYLGELTVSEVAKVLGLSLSSVEKRLQIGKATLKGLLDE